MPTIDCKILRSAFETTPIRRHLFRQRNLVAFRRLALIVIALQDYDLDLVRLAIVDDWHKNAMLLQKRCAHTLKRITAIDPS